MRKHTHFTPVETNLDANAARWSEHTVGGIVAELPAGRNRGTRRTTEGS